jgi:hypothetical protein
VAWARYFSLPSWPAARSPLDSRNIYRQPPPAPPLPAGEAYLPVRGGRIWYKVAGKGAGMPVILLHGGPGYSSFYLKPFEALGDDRPVVRYDQLGGGKSSRISDTIHHPPLRRRARLPSFQPWIRQDPPLRPLLGHHPRRRVLPRTPWARGEPHAWQRGPGHPHLERNARRLVGTLSDSAQRAIRTREAERKYDAPTTRRRSRSSMGSTSGGTRWRRIWTASCRR